MVKTYIGTRGRHGGVCVLVDGVPLPLRLDLARHSPDGFEWGYGGSGPAQLALALLAHALGDDYEALGWYQAFKSRVVAYLDYNGWSLTEDQIREHVRTLRELYPDHAARLEKSRETRSIPMLKGGSSPSA